VLALCPGGVNASNKQVFIFLLKMESSNNFKIIDASITNGKFEESSMKKSAISSAVALALGTASIGAQAALTTGSVLNFDAGTVICLAGGTAPSNCTYGASDVQGSFFTMDANGDGTVQTGEKTPISANDGIIIGTSQAASGSHAGPADGSENPGIDNPWGFFKNTGMHQTTSPVTVVNDLGTVKDLDFSGWSVTWNGIPSINMGGGFQDCGTTGDGICVDNNGNDIGGTYDNGTSLATLTCSASSCSTSSTFTLSYAAVVPQADASGFGGVPYTLTLVGHVDAPAAVPVPAAAWLFGSGLMGLVGVARRRKARA